MESLDQWQPKKIEFVLTDIDDTLTENGMLTASAYQSLWQLHERKIKVIPVTGRPAGWCELIARQWPVAGVVGENGGFYFLYDRQKRKMVRNFFFSKEVQIKNRIRLDDIRKDVLQQVPGCAVASDQFTRLMDLAIDFCEDVTALDEQQVKKIVDVFIKHGAQAKVSSIHVNGWYGDYDKLSMCKEILKNEFQITESKLQEKCVFVGDSPNDEPMFGYFNNSVAVSNFAKFKNQVKHLPKYICKKTGGDGFAEFTDQLLKTNFS